MNSSTKVIGIGGLPRSGKDTLAELFIEHGYYGVSLGDIVRVFSRQRHHDAPDPISVVNMTETSNWLRESRGSAVILDEALKSFDLAKQTKDYQGVVLFSVRAPVEVDYIISHGGKLIWVEAEDEVRHQRGLLHLRDGEISISLAEFKAQEALQWQPQPGIPPEVQMDLSYVKQKATYHLENNDNDVDAFKQFARKVLADYLG